MDIIGIGIIAVCALVYLGFAVAVGVALSSDEVVDDESA